MGDDLVEYYIKATNDRLDKIEGKIDELLSFKWKIIGGSVALSLLISLVFNALEYANK